MHTATKSADHIWMSTQFEIRMNRQDRFVKTTKREMCQYKESELLTRDFVLQNIREINGEVENIRYIHLTKKYDI